jgi:hypothetical protein
MEPIVVEKMCCLSPFICQVFPRKHGDVMGFVWWFSMGFVWWFYSDFLWFSMGLMGFHGVFLISW